MAWHPTLDSIEGTPDHPKDRSRPVTDTQRRENALETIGVRGECWCGQQVGHDWPGHNAGMPHPRERAHVSSGPVA